MKEEHVLDLIDDYVDDELPGKARDRVELHTSRCNECSAVLQSARELLQAVNDLPGEILPPPEIRDNLAREIAAMENGKGKQEGGSGMTVLYRIAATFAVVLTGVAVWWFNRPLPQEVTHAIQQPELPAIAAQPREPNANSKSPEPPAAHRKSAVKQRVNSRIDESPALPHVPDSAVVEQPLPETPPVAYGRITGVVRDNATGEPLVGANVAVKGSMKGAATDIGGSFTINNVYPGDSTLRVSFVGYRPIEIHGVSVQPDSTSTIIANLSAEAIAIQAVEVCAERPIVQKQVAASQVISSHAVPNAYTQRGFRDGGVFLRGGRTEDIRIFVEGTNGQFNTEQYDNIVDNEFRDVLAHPLSTFSIDVDAASYSNVRRFINGGQLPPKDAVRIEEMINYFQYDYPQPRDSHPFSICTESAPAPWNKSHTLLLVGLQGRTYATADLPPGNLVFLLDVSGSMNSPDKLPLVKSAFRLLVDRLRAEDRVAIVVYAGNAGLVLPSTPGNRKSDILEAIDNLEAGGSTAGGAGIQLAYTIARENFLEKGNNRVILATDGDFNVGMSSDGDLVRLIEEKRKEGIYLSVLGFGTGNYKDARMEKLADKGNGNYAYIDNLQEARKVFVGQMAGTLYTIAKDVKIQIEFNPARVRAYRLIGYENRLLAKEDFNDDTKDAGELGAGHSVTALYDIVPAGDPVSLPQVDSLKYSRNPVRRDPILADEVATIKLRYKPPADSTSRLLVSIVRAEQEGAIGEQNNLAFASGVAEFGMLLRDSRFKGSSSYESVLGRARAAKGPDSEGYRAEFIRLVDSARLLAGQEQK